MIKIKLLLTFFIFTSLNADIISLGTFSSKEKLISSTGPTEENPSSSEIMWHESGEYGHGITGFCYEYPSNFSYTWNVSLSMDTDNKVVTRNTRSFPADIMGVKNGVKYFSTSVDEVSEPHITSDVVSDDYPESYNLVIENSTKTTMSYNNTINNGIYKNKTVETEIYTYHFPTHNYTYTYTCTYTFSATAYKDVVETKDGDIYTKIQQIIRNNPDPLKNFLPESSSGVSKQTRTDPLGVRG